MKKTRSVKKVVEDTRSPSEKWLASVRELVALRQKLKERSDVLMLEKESLLERSNEQLRLINELYAELIATEPMSSSFEGRAAHASKAQLRLVWLEEQHQILQREESEIQGTLAFLKRTILGAKHPNDAPYTGEGE